MKELRGRVGVVTGAASGIGLALARRFADEGMHVVMADIEAEALAAARQEVGAAAVTQVTDVGDAASVQALAERVFADYGTVDVLCNNAGVFSGGRIWRRPLEDFEWTLRVNLYGVLHAVRAFVPRMIAQDTDGHIVNTCSVAGLYASPLAGPYTVSKFGAYAASLCLAQELALINSKLRVSALCPGGVATRIHEAKRNRPAELAAKETMDAVMARQLVASAVTSGIPAEDVAEAVIDAIHSERFLILTHESDAVALREYTETLLTGGLPGAAIVGARPSGPPPPSGIGDGDRTAHDA